MDPYNFIPSPQHYQRCISPLGLQIIISNTQPMVLGGGLISGAVMG